MKTIVKSIIATLFIINSSFAFHDVEVANEEIAVFFTNLEDSKKIIYK